MDQKVTSLPALGNRFDTDPSLQQIFRSLPSPARNWAEPVLEQMGARSAADLPQLAHTANKYGPQLQPFDRFGNRVDEIEFHPAYQRLREASYGEGIIGNYYDPAVRRTLGDRVEVVKFAQGYLFAQAEQGLYCPICMTDGVAFLVEKYGSTEQKQEFLPRLTSRNVNELWEGGMHLTERAGGSDVGATQTVAKPLGNGQYALYGQKWFCSNASAEAVAVLARVDDNKPGTRGLGLFLLRRHKDDGSLNNLHLDRLKDKLGTRSMPTGELTLDGAVAQPLGELERGFVHMTDMLNLSRLYNATASVAIVRSVLTEALRYTRVRHTFGRPLIEQPLIQDKLVEVAVELEASMQTLFSIFHLRGKSLNGTIDDQESLLLRIMTPLLKYRTSALAIACASDCLELLGGAGYIEEWPLARLLRDAQVLPVWEGTTNMMVLDTVRSMIKEQAHEALFSYVSRHTSDERLQRALTALQEQTKAVLEQGKTGSLDWTSKLWCDQAYNLMQAATLSKGDDERSRAVGEHFVLRRIAAGQDYIRHTRQHQRLILSSASPLVAPA